MPLWLPFLWPSMPRTSKISLASSNTMSTLHMKSLPGLQLWRSGLSSSFTGLANKYRSNTQVSIGVFRIQGTRSLTDRDFDKQLIFFLSQESDFRLGLEPTSLRTHLFCDG